MQASAVAHPNIALIKYWGKRDIERNIPAVGSLSITLDGLTTTTSILFESELGEDEFVLGGLTGPLNVPGAQPQPAFDQLGRHAEHQQVPKFTTSYGRWGRVVLLLVLAAALAAAAYFGGLWWASRGAAGDPVSLGGVLALLVAPG